MQVKAPEISGVFLRAKEIMMAKEHSKYYGPLMMVLACLCFSTGGVLIKFIPWSSLAINGARSAVAVIVIFIYTRILKHKLKFNLTVLFGAISLFGVTTFFTIANKLTTAGNAIVLQYTAPVWIIVMMALFFKKLPSKLEVITLIIVVIGILCFFFDSIGSGNMLGNFLAVLAGVFYAGMFMINEFENGDSLSSLFFGYLLGAVTLGPLTFRETDFRPSVIIAVLVLGTVQVAIAYILFTESTKYTEPVTASLIAALEPILNPILVAIFFGEIFSPLSLVGACIVVVAVVTYNILKKE